jgi:FAD/FMN-containing dehydrogenase
MGKLEDFITLIENEFPRDRLTYQNAVAYFHPQTADEAARLFRLANKHRQEMYIAGFGNNITPVGSRYEKLVTVCSDRLNDLQEISARDLYVKVGAGYPLREINNHLADENLFIAHGNLPYVGSMGGAIAVGLTADLRGHEIPLKKFFLKAEIVTPEGEIITPGSICFKSTSGYDVVKVFAGSWGLLGFIASATIRAIPDSAREEYADLREKGTNRDGFIAGLIKSNVTTDGIYCRKIKQKFDPKAILPVI